MLYSLGGRVNLVVKRPLGKAVDGESVVINDITDLIADPVIDNMMS
ncbi:MAG: hypothetical protein WAQ29_04255 [Nitrososphaeraceae archaeon]